MKRKSKISDPKSQQSRSTRSRGGKSDEDEVEVLPKPCGRTTRNSRDATAVNSTPSSSGASISSKASSSPCRLTIPEILHFDEDQAIKVQADRSTLFTLPKFLISSILYSGYFDTLYVMRRLRLTCR